MVRPDPQVSCPPSDDHALSDTSQAVRLFHRLIVWLGLRDSVVAITIPLMLLSATLAVLVRVVVAPPMGSFGYLVTAGVAATVTLILGAPLITLAADLILRLDRSQRAQRYLATHDSLTELCNRREFFRRAAHAHERARRSAGSSWLMMIDLDSLEAINDEWGHLAGDRAIRHAADLCRAETRAVDVLGRYGGDKLALLLVGVDHEGALAIATRLRKRIAESALSVDRPRRLRLSASIGLAPLPSPNGTFERGLADADSALRQAKRLGRNRLCVYGDAREAEPVAA